MFGLITPDFRQFFFGKQISNIVISLDIGHGIRTGTSSNRVLIHVFDMLSFVVVATHIGKLPCFFGSCSIQFFLHRREEDFFDQSTFSTSGNSGNHGQDIERKFDVDVLQIILSRSQNFNVIAPFSSNSGCFDFQFPVEVF